MNRRVWDEVRPYVARIRQDPELLRTRIIPDPVPLAPAGKRPNALLRIGVPGTA